MNATAESLKAAVVVSHQSRFTSADGTKQVRVVYLEGVICVTVYAILPRAFDTLSHDVARSWEVAAEWFNAYECEIEEAAEAASASCTPEQHKQAYQRALVHLLHNDLFVMVVETAPFYLTPDDSVTEDGDLLIRFHNGKLQARMPEAAAAIVGGSWMTCTDTMVRRFVEAA